MATKGYLNFEQHVKRFQPLFGKLLRKEITFIYDFRHDERLRQCAYDHIIIFLLAMPVLNRLNT